MESSALPLLLPPATLPPRRCWRHCGRFGALLDEGRKSGGEWCGWPPVRRPLMETRPLPAPTASLGRSLRRQRRRPERRKRAWHRRQSSGTCRLWLLRLPPPTWKLSWNAWESYEMLPLSASRSASTPRSKVSSKLRVHPTCRTPCVACATTSGSGFAPSSYSTPRGPGAWRSTCWFRMPKQSLRGGASLSRSSRMESCVPASMANP
mmetsp:Transcript_27857/g.92602  ORF Transcript_27857/g.92602 Transcript_27857/m.92602 type:complete len:207 (+) Transcript_27857:241-861(+)